MGTRTDELKAEIEGTRTDLAVTMDEVSDRVRPGRIMARRRDRVRQKVASLRQTVIGSAHDPATPSDGGTGTIGSAVDTARHAPESVAGGTQGNPLAAGLIAFGIGFLVASILPTSDVEQQAATQVLDKAQPAIDQARDSAEGAAEDLKGSVSEAAQELRASATDSASAVKDQTKSATGEVRSSASEAAADVKEQSQGSTGKSRGQ